MKTLQFASSVLSVGLIASFAIADFETSASLTTQLSGSTEDDNRATLSPSFGLNYSHPQFLLDTSLSASFSSDLTDIEFDSWQGQTDLDLLPQTQFYDLSLSQTHSETFSSLSDTTQVLDQYVVNASLNFPQSETTIHSVTSSVQWRDFSSDLAAGVDDRVITTGYGLSVAQSPFLSHQGSLSAEFTDSDTERYILSAGSSWENTRYGFDYQLGYTRSQTDLLVSDLITGLVAINLTTDLALFSTSAQRSLTDSLSVLTFAAFDIEFDQINIVELNQLTVSISQLKVSDSISVAAGYRLGETVTTENILDVSNEERVQFGSVTVDVIAELTSSARLTSGGAYSWQEDSDATTAQIGFSDSLTTNWDWNIGAVYSWRNLNDDLFSWQVATTYNF